MRKTVGICTPFGLLLFLTVSLNINFSIVIPIMPVLMGKFGMETEGLSLAFISMILARLISQSAGGQFVMKIGEENILLVNGAVYICVMIVYPFVNTTTAFVALRFFEGIFEGLALVALHSLSFALTKPEERGRKLGYFGSAFGLGFIIGPIIGGSMYDWLGVKGLFWSAAAIGIVGVLALLWMRGEFKVGSRSQVAGKSSILTVTFNNLALLTSYSTYILKRILFVSFMILMPLYLWDTFQLSGKEIALFFTVSAVCTTLLLPHTGKLADRMSPYPIAIMSGLVMSVAIVMFGHIHNHHLLMVAWIVETLGFCFLLPAGMKIFGSVISDHPHKPIIMGAFASLTDAITIVLVVVLVPLYKFSSLGVWYLVSAFCLITSLMLYNEARSRQCDAYPAPL